MVLNAYCPFSYKIISVESCKFLVLNDSQGPLILSVAILINGIYINYICTENNGSKRYFL